MANLKKQALRLQEQEETRQKRLELARARAQNAAGRALAVIEAAVPAGWKAPKEHDAFAFARDFQLEHPDVARIRRMPVPGSKLTVIHVRGQHLALRDLASAGRVRAAQEEMYRVAAALVERGDVAAGHVENWCASDVGVVRKETAKSFYRNKHEEIFVKAAKERVGELPETVREALAKGPQVGDPVYGTLAKLHFEGKLALLPSSVEALENELADEYARTADARRTPESAEGVKAALSPEGDVSRRNDDREDACLRQALRPEFAAFGDVRLVCDGATHDYLANGRRMGVSVVEITTRSVHEAVGTPAQPDLPGPAMSGAKKAAVAAAILAALGGAGAAAYAMGKKEGAAPAAPVPAAPAVPTDAQRVAGVPDAAVPALWKAPRHADPESYVRDFKIASPDVARVRTLTVPGSKLAVIHIRGQHLARDVRIVEDVRRKQSEIYRIARILVDRGDVAAGHVENWTTTDIRLVKKDTPESFYAAKRDGFFGNAARAGGPDAALAASEYAQGVQVGEIAFGALAKLHFEGRIALLPSSTDAMENMLEKEFKRSGSVQQHTEEREDLCLKTAASLAFAPLGNVRLICDGAQHDYLNNGRELGVSVVEITTWSVAEDNVPHVNVIRAPAPTPAPSSPQK